MQMVVVVIKTFKSLFVENDDCAKVVVAQQRIKMNSMIYVGCRKRIGCKRVIYALKSVACMFVCSRTRYKAYL